MKSRGAAFRVRAPGRGQGSNRGTKFWRRLGQGLVPSILGCLILTGCGRALPEEAVVRRVFDGDTVELSGGRLVRYCGIDTPEVRRRVGEIWVRDPEPFGVAASEANRRFVEHQRVRLEYDVETHDRFGRLLAYVYVGETMINAQLLAAGLARPMRIPPNVKYADRFDALAREARQAGRGLWGALTSPGVTPALR